MTNVIKFSLTTEVPESAVIERTSEYMLVDTLKLIGRPVTPPPQPVPFADWPRAHRLLSRRPLHYRGDKGTGDTFFRYAHAVGAGKATKGVEALAKTIGLDWECGCMDRRVQWNQRYPYDGEQGRPSVRDKA